MPSILQPRQDGHSNYSGLLFSHRRLGHPTSPEIQGEELSQWILTEGYTRKIEQSVRVLMQSERHSFWHEIENDIDKEEIEFIKKTLMRFGQKAHCRNLSLMGVGFGTNTITVEISLENDKTKIEKDVKNLLDILDKEAKIFGYDFKRNKPRPIKGTNSIYQKHDVLLKVWDSIDGGKKPEEVAQEMYLRVFKYNAPPPKKKGEFILDDEDGDPVIDQESAIKKVKRYYNEAERMINRGGWRKI